MTPTERGNRSEAAVLAALVGAGFRILLPFGDGHRYDLAIDDGRRILRVQVKTGRIIHGAVAFKTCSQTGGGVQPYADEVDAYGVHEPVSGRCFLVPREVAPTTGMALRLAPSRSGQVRGTHDAADYEIPSALAAAPGQ